MNTELIPSHFQDFLVAFNESGWFNATQAAAYYGKRPVDWLRLDETREYISMLIEVSNCDPGSLLKTRRGRHNSGTWFHPDLAVPFARWCDPRFAIWCDMQIRQILSGQHPHFDWRKMRHASSASFRVMTHMLELKRKLIGKPTAPHHYMNEARLVNFALKGEFKGLDRDSLPHDELDLLAKLEDLNSVLIGAGLDREQRKASLEKFADEHRTVVALEA